MEWRDEGIVLNLRRHGETSAIVEVFTAGHGYHCGVVRGATGRRMAPVLQPGAQLDIVWRARLEDHIGTFTLEPLRSRAAQVMDDRDALAGLNAVTALLGFALPECEAHPALYAHSLALLDMLGVNPLWPLAYLRWELALLQEMGFGLDLARCAVTGGIEGLAYVSPKSGRAVSMGAAGNWADRLLPLPPELLGQGDGARANILDGLRVTGHFLEQWLAPALGDRPLPVARGRLIDRLQKGAP